MAEAEKGLLGKKISMTQMFLDNGEVVPLTAVAAGPCFVTQIRTPEKEGYSAVQLGFEPVTKKKGVKKSFAGQFTKNNITPQKLLKEIRLRSIEGYEVGQELKAELFEAGEKVNVIGTSKGRGFAGVIKRHGFSGGRKTHGSMFHRRPGSIGASAYPSRVMKGKKMPGHMGTDTVTARNIEVIKVDVENNMIYLKGSVPGPNGGMLVIQSVKKKKQEVK